MSKRSTFELLQDAKDVVNVSKSLREQEQGQFQDNTGKYVLY